ncbi:MAG: hypothetical protein IT343_18935 [Candidatus Melainabacteria bacterium]|jgi:hypothetical protein|nr:hypothetical protein [Candidatus Melainabacteria bacterium]
MEFSASSDGRASAPAAETPNWVEGHILNPMANGLVITPYNAVANAVNFATPGDIMGKAQMRPVAQTEFMSGGWLVQNVSHGLGAIVPYVIAGKGAGAVMKGTASKFALNGPAAGFLRSEIGAQVAGAAALDFARDTHGGETRLGNAVGGGVGMFVFAKGNAFTGAADGILQRGATRFAIGSAGGVAGLTSSRLVSGENITGEDILKAGITGGAMNIALPPAQHYITRGFERAGTAASGALNSKPVKDFYRSSGTESLYWSTRASVKDGMTEARKFTHRFLNEHNLSHPVQRFMQGAFPREASVNKPVLTAENNPVNTFEKALPEYFERVKKGEDLHYSKERIDRHKLFYEMQDVKAGFAAKLMEVWHGTADKPGLKHYSDAELATPTTSAERVAQIRLALQQSSKRVNNSDRDALTDSIEKLAPKELYEDLRYDSYSVDMLSLGAQKFYGYDFNKMQENMRMPPAHHHRDHQNYITPNEWMPFDATPQLANLFHGSNSASLGSIIRERGMLSSAELRLRGLEQASGESAGQQFPRRAISITRDFNEALAYTHQGPEYISEFPLVYGISGAIAPRVYKAGSHEPGELLVQKLALGNNWLTRLGFRKPDITNIYAPDGEVNNVMRQLSQNRITGVRVVGFNQMPKPNWHPEPTNQQLIDMGYF